MIGKWVCLFGIGGGVLFACSADDTGSAKTPGQGGAGGTAGTSGTSGIGGGGASGSGGSGGGSGSGGVSTGGGGVGATGGAADAATDADSDAGADATSDAGADAPSLDASDAGADAPSLDASDAGDVTPPVVVSITPADSASGVATLPSIVVTFSEAMQPASLTASTTGTSCSGSLQLSEDGFSTCVPLAGAPTPSAANTVFAVAPAIGLQSLGKYQLRVTTAAKDASGNPLSADHTQPAAWTVRYHHSIVIDGNNDFTADETLSTSTTGYTAYAAWDDTFFYAGLKGPDVSSASATKFWVCYLGSTAGTTTGVSYNTQQPGLPFAAKWHVRWKSDNTFTDALVFGSAWGPASWSFAGDILQKNDYVEMRVGWTDFAETITTLKFATYMLNEQGSSEFSYAAAPAAAFTDSYDADVAKYFAFDPAASVTPKQSPILP